MPRASLSGGDLSSGPTHSGGDQVIGTIRRFGVRAAGDGGRIGSQSHHRFSNQRSTMKPRFES